MTVLSANAGFMKGGVLELNRPGDMVILSEDWLKAPDKVLQSRVIATMMDGKVAYRDPELKERRS